MPNTLEKARKQIAKKRRGGIGALHTGSRDSKRLHKAQVRDERLEKLATARRKQEQAFTGRVTYFQNVVREGSCSPLSLDAVRQHIKTFVHRHDDEMAAAKSSRRPGRPPSTKEDLLGLKMLELEKEYKAGFLVPDVTSRETVSLLDQWEGSWSYLATLSWVRISDSGEVNPSGFPPSGDH